MDIYDVVVSDQTNPGSGYTTAEDTEIPESRKALVKALLSGVEVAKRHWKPVFDQMIKDQDFARGKQWEELAAGLNSEDNYTANLVQRHIQTRVAALYAKNPKVEAKRRERMDYVVWDGEPATITKAEKQMQAAVEMGMEADPTLLAILQDFHRVQMHREQMTRVAKTMELLYEYFVSEQVRPFKKEMKRVVRRVLTNGVAFVKLGFQRVMRLDPEVERQIGDAAAELARLERLAREFSAGDFDEMCAEYNRLQNMIKALQAKEQVIAREGLVFEYPKSTAIIPDVKCRSLDGFVGCDWVAEEFFLSVNEIKEVYDVDIGSNFKAYQRIEPGSAKFTALQDAQTEPSRPGESFACVYVIYHKRDGLVYTVCEGYPDFLAEPAAPDFTLERFWPIYTLMFNECEHDEQVYPPSDVTLIRSMQHEYNRSRQAKREHRRANRPKTYVAAGKLGEADIDKLITHPANAVIELEGLQPGEKIEDVLQPHKPPPIDPALYDTKDTFDDILRVVGTQEANFGGTSAATATESSIAESSRLSSLQSNVDDLDEFLSEIARGGGQICLQLCSTQTVKRVVGPGAAWPNLSRQEVAEELYLEIKAGSSGRPNQAQAIQNFERLAPWLVQIPGIDPQFLASEALHRLDDKLDLSRALAPAMPSILAMNGAKQALPGPPDEQPEQQGAEGAVNAPRPQEAEGGRPGRPPMDPNLTMDNLSGLALN